MADMVGCVGDRNGIFGVRGRYSPIFKLELPSNCSCYETVPSYLICKSSVEERLFASISTMAYGTTKSGYLDHLLNIFRAHKHPFIMVEEFAMKWMGVSVFIQDV